MSTVTRRDKMQVTIMLIINVEAAVVKCHGRKRKENVGSLGKYLHLVWIIVITLYY